MLKIALDYDQTVTTDPDFWYAFRELVASYGHDVRIVTARSPTKDNIDKHLVDVPIIYCDGVAKRFVCHHFHDWDPDIWIDDKPQSVDNNSTATKEILKDWRDTREH